MGKGEVLFEKKWPKEDLEDLVAEVKSDIPKDEIPTFNEIMERMTEGAETVELPERRESVKTFIQTAVKTAEFYELDVKVTRYDTHVTANFSFNCAGNMGFLKEVIAYADDIAFFNNIDGYDITLSLDHYTHAVYRHGIKFRPSV